MFVRNGALFVNGKSFPSGMGIVIPNKQTNISPANHIL